MQVLSGNNNDVVKMAVNANQTIAQGDLLVISGGKVSTAAAAPTAATVLGVATSAITTGASVTAADVVYFEPIKGKKVRASYTGSTKTSVTDADLGTTFDLSDKKTVNLDDTLGGVCVCVGYDNTNDTIDFIATVASLFI